MELSLNGPVGQVYALVVNNDMLFAGTQVNLFLFHYVFVLFRFMLYFLLQYSWSLMEINLLVLRA